MELKPITQQEQIIAGKDLQPITRMEKFLKEYGGSGGSGGAQPDWNAAEGEPGHILNRPFGESTEVLFDQRVEIEAGEGNVFQYALPISAGDSVKVTWNGAEYECTAGTGSNNLVFFGNPAIMGGEDNGIPFIMATGTYNGEGMLGITAPDFVGQTVSVKVEGKTVKTIDPKFLPAMSSYCHVNIWYDENDGEYKSDKTYDDIKAAEAKKTPVIGTLTVPSGNVYTLVGCDAAPPSAYLVAFDLYDLPTTLKVFRASIGERNNVSVLASNLSGTASDL